MAADASGHSTGSLSNQKRILREAHKLARKRATQLDIFAKSENLPLSELVVDVENGQDPTRFIVILNAGSTGDVGGVSVDDLERAFGAFEGFLGVEMMLGKPYSYAVYNTPTAAFQAYTVLNNSPIPIPHSNSKPLLLTFTTRVSLDIALSDPKDVMEAVPGLFLLHDFVDCEEEQNLLACVKDNANSWVSLNKRRVQHYGYRFDYPLNTVDFDTSIIDPIPPWGQEILSRYCRTFPLHSTPDQLTVNEYWPSAGIAPHADRHSIFGDVVIALSLGSGVVMEFRRPEETPSTTVSNPCKPFSYHCINIHLPPRSLLVMSGNARYQWEHSIRPRRTDIVHGRAIERGTRVSLTFRNVKRVKGCECGWTHACDVGRDDTGRLDIG
ncbi:uncharacterized protein SPPG_06848 [Spizellomyces punctatus DAOM BR117]|uniref:Fe2OG dioxygenase domain-containing protein n=1 Tax=Spizellomyces punctatus (strain DAOM BR117) TaxID=645134 RepID=A0A0L0H9I1_SPIPD|nr:uncharacterized protein SPPG_06848 [Spizellomyces punctatus DAOM BR117]KNC97852.1 hypothetical protein SPPG_06848 [Spizellomyces punctatus DAOM BR117]|eukprot:XP_016605892.1 hypothetical protein SPPG_06848 [Spizellomyces punctatus DAOM BR117]